MFDGIVRKGWSHRLYRITRDAANQWRVLCPEAGPESVFAKVDGALAFVRGDSGARPATVELMADNMYIVKHLDRPVHAAGLG